MRKFLRLLTVAMQVYLEQSALESESPAVADGEINIPLTEIAAYAVFWDKYLSRYPNSAVSLEAKQLRKRYSALLIEGEGKMLAFQDKKLQTQFKNAYLAMTTQMGVSPLIKSFKAYYEILENQGICIEYPFWIITSFQISINLNSASDKFNVHAIFNFYGMGYVAAPFFRITGSSKTRC